MHFQHPFINYTINLTQNIQNRTLQFCNKCYFFLVWIIQLTIHWINLLSFIHSINLHSITQYSFSKPSSRWTHVTIFWFWSNDAHILLEFPKWVAAREHHQSKILIRDMLMRLKFLSFEVITFIVDTTWSTMSMEFNQSLNILTIHQFSYSSATASLSSTYKLNTQPS